MLEGGGPSLLLREPRLDRRHDLLLRTSRQFDPRAIPHAVDGIGEQPDEFMHRPAGDRHRCHERPTVDDHPVHAAMHRVPARVAQVVLHVADDGVVPVGEPDGAVGPHLDVRGTEVGIGARHDRLHLDRPGERVHGRIRGGLERVAQDALKPDDVAHEEVALERLGEVRTREHLDRGAGSRALLVDARRLRVLFHAVEPRREDAAPVGHRPGAVDDDVVPPAIERVAVRIGERVGGVEPDLSRARLVAEHGAVGHAGGWTPGALRLRVVERALLKIEGTGRIEREAVGRVVRVRGVEAVDDAALHVGAIVAVGVLQVEDVRPLRDDHALPPELEAGGIVQVAREGGAPVRAAVTVGVLEDEQFVVHRAVRSPVRIGGPRRHPEPALRVERHLHGIDELGKHRLVGEEHDPHPGMHRHRGDRRLPGEELVGAARQRPRLVRGHRDQFR